MSLKDHYIKNEYRSLLDDVVNEFYIPLLKEAKLYQRAVGFFTSSALARIADGIEGLIENGGKIQIIASPKLTIEDIEEIKKGYELRNILEKALIREMEIPEEQKDTEKLSYIAKLVSEGVLDIKIAFLTSGNEISMYHEKMGIIVDNENNAVAFSGSMNETSNAFSGNYESFDAFCSWTADEERVFQKQMAFKAIWEDYEPGVETIDFPEAAKRKLYEYNTELKENLSRENKIDNKYSEDLLEFDTDKDIYLPQNFKIRDYQLNAIEKWKDNDYRGIYDMATGTGKTLTALASIESLYRDNSDRLAVIIICPYQHLVEQWVEDIVEFGMNPIIGYSSSSQKKWDKKLEQAVRSFNLHVSNHFCFVTTNASFITPKVQKEIIKLGEDTVIVVDEAHNMGASNYRRFLPHSIKYRLALSATIERHNDEIGTGVLKKYFGQICINYSLKDAIDNDMLTRYYYYPVITSLDLDELDEYLVLTKQISKGVKLEKGKTILTEFAKQLLIKRSRIIAGARNKIEVLEREIMPYIDDTHILVYCGATVIKDEVDHDNDNFGVRQIDKVTDLLGNKLNMRVGRFTSQESAQERIQIKKAFAEGDVLQTLVAIKCLDEGVNIPSIKTAFILASSTNPKEYIQRRGRVLRKFEGKDVARIYDFITLPFEIDNIDYQSEDVLNSTRGLVVRELIRILDFAELAENPSMSMELVYELKHKFNILEEELNYMEVENNVI